jgi:hypothetical protein
MPAKFRIPLTPFVAAILSGCASVVVVPLNPGDAKSMAEHDRGPDHSHYSRDYDA